MMKRGCRVGLVHFHAFPLQDRTIIDKVTELAGILTRFQLATRLFLVPFGRVQQTIVAACPAPLRVVLYRRFMIRIADALAVRHGGKALVTGESLGQVASQTLDNLAVIDEAAARAGPAAARRHGQGRDHGRGTPHRDLRRRARCPTRTAASSSCRRARRWPPASTRCAEPKRRSTSPISSPARWRRPRRSAMRSHRDAIIPPILRVQSIEGAPIQKPIRRDRLQARRRRGPRRGLPPHRL